MSGYVITHEGRSFTPNGATETPAQPVSCFCCGDECKSTSPISAGYALWHGNPWCYDCAGKRERQEFLQSSVYVGYYTSKDGKATITTWTGAELARVFETWTGRHNMARRLRYWRAVDALGRVWYGKFSEDNRQLTTMRRAK